MTIRLSTNQFYARSTSQMAKLNADLTRTQDQIATGKMVAGAADSPAGYQRLQGLARATADDGAYSANIKLAQGIVAQGDSTLASVESQIQRAKELATQAANGTLSDADRTAAANELDSIRDAIFGLANTQDVRGQPLFGGASGDTAYTRDEDGTIRLTDSGQPAAIPIGDGDAMQTNVSGAQLFASGDGDVFALLATLSDALRQGGDDAATAAGDALDGLSTTLDNVAAGRASLGARGARLDLAAAQITDANTARETERSAIEDTDVTTAITELQRTMTVLQATQSSFTKLSSLTLFDYIK
ncbi:flagellar hook-associated protein FlgL [Sphingomonas sp. RS6]